jgi:hypothetical protein
MSLTAIIVQVEFPAQQHPWPSDGDMDKILVDQADLLWADSPGTESPEQSIW